MESSSYDSLEYIVDGQIYGLNLKTHDEKCQGDEELLQVISSFKPQGSTCYLFIVKLPKIASPFELRSSRPGGVLPKSCPKFRKIHRKILVLVTFYDVTMETLLKRDSDTCFPVNIAKFLRTPFFTEHLRATASVSIKQSQ